MSDSVLGFSLCLHSSLFTMSWQVPLPSFYVLQKMSPNSAARQLTYSFLSDLCPLHLHFIGSFAPSQFPSLYFPPRVGYFWFKHFFCQACRAISQLLPSFQLPDTADIQSPLSPHVSKISKKILNNVPREFGESISQVNNPWKGDYESLCVSLWGQMHLLQNFTLSSASGTQGLFLFYDMFIITRSHLPTVCK